MTEQRLIDANALRTIQSINKANFNSAEFIKSLKSTDREFVRQMLEEFERQEGAEKE